MNFHFAVALAFLVFAAWIRLSPRGALWRWLLFAPLAVVVWIAHIAGWAVLLLLVGCWQLGTEIGPRAQWRGLPVAIARAATWTLPVVLPVGFTLFWRSAHASVTHEFVLLKKAIWILWLLRAESALLDGIAVALLAFAGLWLFGNGARRRHHRIMLGAAALLLCFFVLPQWVFGSNFADARLLPVFGMVFFIGLAAPDRRSAALVAMLGLTLFAARLGSTTWGWHVRGSHAVADLRVLDTVPRGARIAVLRSESICGPWALHGLDHLGSLAIIRREAFVNTQWDVAGAQLMRPVYNLGQGFNSSESGLIESGTKNCGLPLPVALSGIPRERFDYVWVFGSEPKVPWLHQVAAGTDGRLYLILPRIKP